MNSQLPQIATDVLVAFAESAPGRVRKRLDRNPTAADDWNWQKIEGGFQVQAGEETVELTFQDNVIRSVSQLRCTCLLAPQCFHVLACVTSLVACDEVADGGPSSGHEEAPDPIEWDDEAAMRSIDVEMRSAATAVEDAVANIVRVGARAAGTLLQSGLLRAGHECRAVNLPMLANTTLRIAESIRQIRAQANTADTETLRDDLFLAFDVAQRLRNENEVPAWVIGSNRRNFQPLEVSRLEGWFAEPILTRSGYAGVCIHLLTPTGALHQIIEARPGDSQFVQQAYNGGIELGAVTESGRTLASKRMLVQNLTASPDRRLGKGKKTRWVMHEKAGFGSLRFDRPLAEQVAAVLALAAEPGDQRHAGWDLIAFDAELIGPSNMSLLAQGNQLAVPWRMTIANSHPDLAFRENLELLARCPRLRLRCVGRLRIEAAGAVELLAISDSPSDPGGDSDKLADPPRPCLRLPDHWNHRCNLGLDRLERHHIENVSRWGDEVHLAELEGTGAANDGLAELERRLDAVTLGGYRALAGPDSRSHRRDVATLSRRGLSTAAMLVDRLAMASRSISLMGAAAGTERSMRAADFGEVLLASATYFRAARAEFHRQCWNDKVREGEGSEGR